MAGDNDVELKIGVDAAQGKSEISALSNLFGAEFAKIAQSVMGIIGPLTGVIGPLQGTASSLKSVAGEVEEVHGGFSAATGAVSGIAGPLMVAAAAAVVFVGALVEVIQGTFELTEKVAEARKEMGEMSVRTGISVQSLSLFKFAAGESGVGLQAITQLLTRYQQNLFSAAHGNETAAAGFVKLGIDAKEAMQNPEEALMQILERIGELDSTTDKLGSCCGDIRQARRGRNAECPGSC